MFNIHQMCDVTSTCITSSTPFFLSSAFTSALLYSLPIATLFLSVNPCLRSSQIAKSSTKSAPTNLFKSLSVATKQTEHVPSNSG